MSEPDDEGRERAPANGWLSIAMDFLQGPREPTPEEMRRRRVVAWRSFAGAPIQFLLAGVAPLLAFAIVFLLHTRDWLPGAGLQHDFIGNALRILFFVIWNFALICLLTWLLGLVLLTGEGALIRVAQVGVACVLGLALYRAFVGTLRGPPAAVAAVAADATAPSSASPPVVETPAPSGPDRSRDVDGETFESPQARAARLAASARKQWRADLEAAGAFGPPGEIPPMLDVIETTDTIDVTNRTRAPLCVRIARVTPGSAPLQRCVIENLTCRSIGAGASHRFRRFRSDDSPTCTRGKLEFRVGSFDKPEPTWWTRTALDEFDSQPTP